MADVKIVDIDNVQWNMKDQVARNEIANMNKSSSTTVSGCGLIFNFMKIGNVVTMRFEGTWTENSTNSKTGVIKIPKSYTTTYEVRTSVIDNSIQDKPIGQLILRKKGNENIDIYSGETIKKGTVYVGLVTYILM